MGLGVAPSLTFQKLCHLGGVQNFLLERRGKTEKGSWCRNGRMPLFYYFTVQSQLLCVWMKVRFPLLLFRSSVFWVSHEGFSSKSLLHWNLVSFVNFWSILVVCKKFWLLHLPLFAIHWKVNGQFLLSVKARCFLILKRF